MTEASTELDFSNVRRNDPCPCGSGKKFKKCHFKTVQVQKQVQQQQVQLNSFIGGGQYPFQWLKGLQMLVNRRAWSVIHEVFEEGSKAHKTAGTLEEFIERSRSSSDSVPASNDFKVRRYHVVEEFAFIMGVRNRDDRRSKSETFEVIALRNSARGYRITEIQHKDVVKGPEMVEPTFEDFSCFDDVYKVVKARDWTRPVVHRWDEESQSMVLPEGARDTSGVVAADGALIDVAANDQGSEDVAPAAPAVQLLPTGKDD